VRSGFVLLRQGRGKKEGQRKELDEKKKEVDNQPYKVQVQIRAN